MFKFLFGNPIKKREKLLAKVQEKAMFAQRNGNMALFAELSSDADKMYKEILEMKKKKEEK
jgi:hypothetical protein